MANLAKILQKVTLVAAADFSSAQYRFIVVDSAGKAALAGDGEIADGVVQNAPELGKGAVIALEGISFVEVGVGGITAGDEAASDANGKVVTAAVGESVSGIAMATVAEDGLAAILIRYKGGTSLDTMVTLVGTETLTNKTLTSPKINEDVELDATATQLNRSAIATKLYELGTPAIADVDKIVVSADMKVGTFTIAASPDIPRNVTVTHTQVGGVTDTLGTITIVGTDINDVALTEVLTPSENATVSGVKAFKTVASATGAGWVIDTTADTVTIGQGNELGLPIALADVLYMVLGMLDFTMLAHNPTTDTTLAGTTVDMSGGTYDGSKTAKVLVIG